MEFMKDFRSQCGSSLEFHAKKADRSLCPRRSDFNTIYRQYFDELFGGKNGSRMFECLESKLSTYKRQNPTFLFSYNPYDGDKNEPLVLVLVTPLMVRVCEKVRYIPK